jgi:hypothetical protein
MDRPSELEQFETVIIGGGQAGLAVGTTWPGEVGSS